MRRLLAALLAVPVILTTYRPATIRRPTVSPALIALLVPVALIGISVVRLQVPPTPVAAGVAGVSATPFPDTAFAPVAVAVSPTQPLAVPRSLPATPVEPPDRPDRGLTRGRAAFHLAARPVPPAPAVVRFRPLAEASDVPAMNDVSVRFTEAMDEAVTSRTFSVTVDGKAVTGRIHWAEGSTVLVMDPAKPFAPGATVVLTVTARAKSAAGAFAGGPTTSRFTVAKPAPKPKATAKSAKGTGSRVIPRSVAPGLRGVELYALELMNCTRTGGWVLSNGTCRGAGTRNVAPLKLDAGISDTVARPYAHLLASRRLCNHFYDGNPGYRLRRAGYTNWDWAENVGGCGSNAPYASVLSTHIYFQSEKSYNGGHYRNLMNRIYDRVGIGIVKVNGVFRMVVNFYHP